MHQLSVEQERIGLRHIDSPGMYSYVSAKLASGGYMAKILNREVLEKCAASEEDWAA